MQITEEFTYAAPVETVFAMVTDPEFQERKSEASNALKSRIDVQTDEAGNTVVVATRRMSNEILPEQFRGFFANGLKIQQTDTWAPASGEGRTATTQVEIVGTPVVMNGTVTLTPADGGTHVVLDADLKANIPMMGRKIEKASAPALQAAIADERKTGEAWLAERA